MSRAARVLSLARNRQGIRRFQERPVPTDLLECVLEAACYAPSAKEAQPWRFVVVRDTLARHQLATAAFNHPLTRTAPVIVLCCARIHTHVSGHGRPSHPVDLAAAAQSLVLAAADLGIGAAWITGFREAQAREVVGVPADVPIIAMLTLGYPEGIETLPPRRPPEEVIGWERWASTTITRTG